MLPFDYIYLDSNVLIEAGYPKGDTTLENVIALASIPKIPVVIPDQVRRELEEHWLRELDLAQSQMVSQRKKYNRATHGLVEQIPRLTFPSRDEARNQFEKAVRDALWLQDVEGCPASNHSLADLFEMSVSRAHVFHEEQQKTLQDICIYLAIVEHLSESGKLRKAAFVTNDHNFQSPRFAQIASDAGTEIIIFTSLREFYEDISGKVVHAAIEKERDMIKKGLIPRMNDIKNFIVANLEIAHDDYETVREIGDSIEQAQIEYIMPPIETDKPFNFMFDVGFKVTMLVDLYVAPERKQTPLKIGQPVDPIQMPQFGTYHVMPVTKTKTATVEATGFIENGNFYLDKLTSAREKLPFPWKNLGNWVNLSNMQLKKPDEGKSTK